MPRSRSKLTDEQIDAIRAAAERGQTLQAIADVFGTSKQHVSRIVRGEQRQPLPAVDVHGNGSVTAAVRAMLARGGFEPDEEVPAATALALAEKLDAVRAANTAQSAMAAPGLAKQLSVALADLRDVAADTAPRLDRLRGEAAILVARELGYPDPENIDVEWFDGIEAIRLRRARRIAANPEHYLNRRPRRGDGE